mmetsp:Transcript_23730/g.40251  ORF Transcript_23730/g.40251 Transcript_23730/m.40251 type:complete len:141 (+) Transcript_23730:103-525(+)
MHCQIQYYLFVFPIAFLINVLILLPNLRLRLCDDPPFRGDLLESSSSSSRERWPYLPCDAECVVEVMKEATLATEIGSISSTNTTRARGMRIDPPVPTDDDMNESCLRNPLVIEVPAVLLNDSLKATDDTGFTASEASAV